MRYFLKLGDIINIQNSFGKNLVFSEMPFTERLIFKMGQKIIPPPKKFFLALINMHHEKYQ